MFCKNCGQQLPDDAKFCGGCGATILENGNAQQQAPAAQQAEPIKPVLKVQPKEPKPKKEKKKVNKGLIIGICAVLVIAIVAAVLIPVLFPRETIYVLVSETTYWGDGSVDAYISYEYDDCARLISREVDKGEVTESWDDELGVYIFTADEPDGKLDEVTEYTYDEYGNLTSQESDWYGSFEVEYEYDEDGRFVSYLFSAGSDVEYFCEYDEDGRLISARTDLYDGYGVELGYSFTYDSEGRLESETEYRKDCTILCEYNYDGDLLSSVDYYQAPTIPDAEFTYLYSNEYEYDKEGRLEERFGRSCAISYEYDDQGFLEESDFETHGGPIEYTCDEFGNITCVEFSDSSRIELEYEKMTVTPEQADAYRNRFICINLADGLECFQYQNCIFYYMIPNPRWETYLLYEYFYGWGV